jgi:AraC family transcriptional regulator, transcriptional activator of the genes for pyochelin and ferripyochelin receptors
MRYSFADSAVLRARTSASGWARRQLPDGLGNCFTDSAAADDELTVMRTRYRPARDLIEQSEKRDGRRTLVISVGLAGASSYHSRDGHDVAFRDGHTTVTSFGDVSGERHYAAAVEVAQLRVAVGEARLIQYAGQQRARELLGSSTVRQLAFHASTAASVMHARALWHIADRRDAGPSGPAGPADPLAIHIHALSLLAEQLRLLRASPVPERPAPDRRFSQNDIEKLEQARVLMLTHLNRSLTIPYLAAAVGLNEFKLKEGFRHRFNSSPHRMLTGLRMQHAWALLETGCQVAEAAYQVGFGHPGNFSAAFTRYFGRMPKSVFGKRR